MANTVKFYYDHECKQPSPERLVYLRNQVKELMQRPQPEQRFEKTNWSAISARFQQEPDDEPPLRWYKDATSFQLREQLCKQLSRAEGEHAVVLGTPSVDHRCVGFEPPAGSRDSFRR